MSEDRKQPFIHPFNFYIVTYGVEAFHKAFVEDRYIDAVQNLYVFVGWLEPEIQERLKNEIVELEMMMMNPRLVNVAKLRHIQLKVSKLLHEAGYFLQAKAVKKVMVGYEEGMAPEVKT